MRENVLGFAVARVLRNLEEGSGDLAELASLVDALEDSAASAADRTMLEQYVNLVEANARPELLARSLEHARRARLGLSRSEGSQP